MNTQKIGRAWSEGSRLAPIDDSVIPSYGIVRRALAISLLTVASLIAIGVVTSFLVQMNVTADANGVMEQLEIWPVRPFRAGVVSAILIGTGDTVQRGQVIAQLDSADAANALRSLRFDLKSGTHDLEKASEVVPLNAELGAEKVRDAEARLIRAKAALREQLVEMSGTQNTDSVLRDYVSGRSTRIDLAVADVRSAEAALRSAAVSLKLTDLDSTDLARRRTDLVRTRGDVAHSAEQFERLKVLSPVAGVVLTDQLERLVGTHVEAGEQLLEIADPHGWRALLFVGERDVHNVQIGQIANIEIPALKQLDGRRILGRIVSVAPQPAAGGTVEGFDAPAGYRVVVKLNADQVDSLGAGALRRGYAVRGKIVTRKGKIATLLLAFVRDRINKFR